MKTFLLIKKPTDSDIAGIYAVVYRNTMYPLSKKSTTYIEKNYPHLPNEGITLTDKNIELMIKPRRVKEDDIVHISKIPSNQFTTELGDCINLKAVVLDSNNDSLTVQLLNCGLRAKTLKLNRRDVVLMNISDTHKIAYFICSTCDTKL
jgi:hypothetical protein